MVIVLVDFSTDVHFCNEYFLHFYWAKKKEEKKTFIGLDFEPTWTGLTWTHSSSATNFYQFCWIAKYTIFVELFDIE